MIQLLKNDILIFLDKINSKLKRKITLIAVGETAMVLLDLKKSTDDMDFNIPLEIDYNEFQKIINEIEPEIKIDYYTSNMIFSEVLPTDYQKIAIKCNSQIDKIDLYALNPIDIICSKISRLNESDIEDIKACISYSNFTKSQIKERAMQYEHAGSDEVFNQNLEYVLETLF